MIEKSNESIDMEGPRRHLVEINKEEEEGSVTMSLQTLTNPAGI